VGKPFRLDVVLNSSRGKMYFRVSKPFRLDVVVNSSTCTSMLAILFIVSKPFRLSIAPNIVLNFSSNYSQPRE
jgi:hypothetical protein